MISHSEEFSRAESMFALIYPVRNHAFLLCPLATDMKTDPSGTIIQFQSIPPIIRNYEEMAYMLKINNKPEKEKKSNYLSSWPNIMV